MPKQGMLIQMDGSQHRWLASVDKPWWLIATIDDAANEVLFAKFYPSEDVFSCMGVIRKSIEKKGGFIASILIKLSILKPPVMEAYM